MPDPTTTAITDALPTAPRPACEKVARIIITPFWDITGIDLSKVSLPDLNGATLAFLPLASPEAKQDALDLLIRCLYGTSGGIAEGLPQIKWFADITGTDIGCVRSYPSGVGAGDVPGGRGLRQPQAVKGLWGAKPQVWNSLSTGRGYSDAQTVAWLKAADAVLPPGSFVVPDAEGEASRPYTIAQWVAEYRRILRLARAEGISFAERIYFNPAGYKKLPDFTPALEDAPGLCTDIYFVQGDVGGKYAEGLLRYWKARADEHGIPMGQAEWAVAVGSQQVANTGRAIDLTVELGLVLSCYFPTTATDRNGKFYDWRPSRDAAAMYGAKVRAAQAA